MWNADLYGGSQDSHSKTLWEREAERHPDADANPAAGGYACLARDEGSILALRVKDLGAIVMREVNGEFCGLSIFTEPELYADVQKN